MIYFDEKINPNFLRLYLHRMIVFFATGLLGVFLPIFIFETLGKDIAKTALFYGLASLLSFVLQPAVGLFINRFGLKFSIFLGVIFNILTLTLFHFTDSNNAYLLLPIAIFTISLFRTAYWVPYHTNFANLSQKQDRTRLVAFLQASGIVIAFLMPLVAGLILTFYSYDFFFLLSIVIFLLSVVPILSIKNAEEKFSWSYLETFKKFFAKNNRAYLLSLFANSAENTIAVVVWPLFVFTVLQGSYIKVASVAAFTTLAVFVTLLFVARLADKKKVKKKVVKYGAYMNALAWLAKITVATFQQIFFIDAYQKISKAFYRSSFEALSYDYVADKGHFKDEFTALREMAISLGRFFTCILIIALSFLLPLQALFVVAALATLFVNFMPKVGK